MVADTRSFGGGWTPNALVAGASGTITPPVPCNVDFGEAFVHNITQAVIRGITSFTKDTNDLVTLITMDTTGWLVTDRYCIVMSSTSTNHSTLGAALSAKVGTDDIVMGTPNAEDPAALVINGESDLFPWTFSDVTVRSFSPLVKITGMTFVLQQTAIGGLVIEDAIIQRIKLRSLTHVATFRRCMIIGVGDGGHLISMDSNLDAGSSFIFESCITVGARLNGILHNTANADVFVRHHLDVGSIDSYDIFGTTARLNGCAAIPKSGGFVGTPNASSDHNWTTTPTAPGGNSLVNRAVDDAKLTIFEHPSAIPNNLILPFMAYFPEAASEWKGAATFISGMDRRDFFGYLRPTTGVWTMGPVNLETTNGGVAWPGYGAADAAAPGKATGVSVASGQGKLEVNFTTPTLSDRVGFAIAETVTAALSFGNAGIFSHVEKNLAASTAFSNRSLVDLTNQNGTNIVDGTKYQILVVPGNSDGVFNTSGVAADVKFATPSAANTPPTLTVDGLDKDGTLRFSISNTGGAAWQIQVFDVTDGKELTAISGTGDQADQTFVLNPVNTHKLVPMITAGGNRTNAGEPVWAGAPVGVH